MVIRLTKKTDGTTVLRCERDDGSFAWQRQKTGFFAYHDLGHYAIETTLGLRDGFLGLMAQGWDFEDFGNPYPRGPIGPDAALAEFLAGAFDLERSGGFTVVAEEFNQMVAEKFDGDASCRRVTDSELDSIRATIRTLLMNWADLPPGDSMELQFPPSALET